MAIAPPRVSVLIPAFNAAETLAPCLRSVQRQSRVDWECVVVDDGSADATPSVAARFAAVDPRFRIVSGEHHGLVAALNHGLEACRGELVARMDADDLMHRQRLELQVGAMEQAPELSAVGCHVRLFPRAGLGTGSREYESWLNSLETPAAVTRDAFVECPVAHPSMMFRRSVLSELGYRDRDWPEDYDLVLRILEGGAGIGVVPRRLLLWRDSPSRLSRTSERYSIDRFIECKAAFLAGGFLAGTERFHLWGYGSTGRKLAAALRQHGKRPSHVVELHPGRLGNQIDGAPVIEPAEFPELPRAPLIVSVARITPRQRIRRFLNEAGFVELGDYVCAA